MERAGSTAEDQCRGPRQVSLVCPRLLMLPQLAWHSWDTTQAVPMRPHAWLAPVGGQAGHCRFSVVRTAPLPDCSGLPHTGRRHEEGGPVCLLSCTRTRLLRACESLKRHTPKHPQQPPQRGDLAECCGTGVTGRTFPTWQ